MHAVLLTLLLAQSPSLSFEANARPLTEHLKELSSLSGLNLSAEPSVGSQIMVFRMQKVAPQELLEKIAYVTVGKWDRDGDKYILRPDPTRAEAERLEDLQLRIDAVRKWQAKKVDSVDGPFTPQMAKDLVREYNALDLKSDFEKFSLLPNLQDRLPASGALSKIVSHLDPKVLAEEADLDLVYSDRPNRLQSQLPPKAVEELRQFEEDHRVWVSACLANQVHIDGRQWYRDPRRYTKSLPKGAMRLLLRIKRKAPGGGRGNHRMVCGRQPGTDSDR